MTQNVFMQASDSAGQVFFFVVIHSLQSASYFFAADIPLTLFQMTVFHMA